VSPAATIGAAIVAVIIGVGQLASTAMTASSGPALHPEDVVVTSLSPAPLAARQNAIAVSTGREVIIWGGDDGAGRFFADGATYELATGKWHRIAPAPISGRSRAAAAWVGNRMIVWGGVGAYPSPRGLADGAAYDLATNSWQKIASAPYAGRQGALAIAFAGQLYIAGGVTPTDAQMSRSILQYDLASGAWRTVGTVNPVYAAVTTSAGLVTAELDRSSGMVTSHLIEPAAASARSSDIDARAVTGGIQGVTLVSDAAKPLLVTTNSAGMTTAYILTISSAGARWTATAAVSTAAFHAVNDVNSTFSGAMARYSGGIVLAVSSQGVWDLRMNSGRAVLGDQDMLRHSICGAGSAYAVTAKGIVVWGGQSCRPNGPLVISSGDMISLRNAPRRHP